MKSTVGKIIPGAMCGLWLGVLGATSACQDGAISAPDAGIVVVVDAAEPPPPADLADLADAFPSGDMSMSMGGTKDVDVLFVMDNSPSMAPKQKALVKSIALFVSGLEAAGLDYHIGIASTDIGTDVDAATPWGGALGTCDTYLGDDGVMQSAACPSRSGTPDAQNACAQLCPDSKFVPTDGKRFISKVSGVSNVPVNMVLDPMTGKMVDTGPSRAFQCMAMLGDSGCGIESPLESARRALDNHRAENTGFLRPNSLLAVIFLTDEDDCSVQLARRSENNPTVRDCATPDNNASYDCFNIDYRCLARSVTCDQPMNSAGVKTNCKERAANYLEPLSKYTTFFNTLRPAGRLMISGIWTLPGIDKGGKVQIAYSPAGMATPYLNRAPGAAASCVYGGDANIFGQAQLRLSSFAANFTDAQQFSVCDIDAMPANLGQITAAIAAKAKK